MMSVILYVAELRLESTRVRRNGSLINNIKLGSKRDLVHLL
jgi:hypothetical protein